MGCIAAGLDRGRAACCGWLGRVVARRCLRLGQWTCLPSNGPPSKFRSRASDERSCFLPILAGHPFFVSWRRHLGFQQDNDILPLGKRQVSFLVGLAAGGGGGGAGGGGGGGAAFWGWDY